MIEAYLDDPRHRRSEEIAFEAERQARRGYAAEALSAYEEAARLEESVAIIVVADEPRTRTLFAISAVSLWLKAAQWEEAARCGCLFLALPQQLTLDGRRELAAFVDRAWRSRELDAYFADRGAYAGIEARLDGGTVRKGIAPANVLAERREVLVPMLFRVAEWRTKRKFRKAGPSSFTRELEVVEAPALAASYTIRLFVGLMKQQKLPASPGGPKDVVESFLQMAAAVSEGVAAIRDLVRDETYARAFIRGFRDLAADGTIIGSVEFSEAGLAGKRVKLLAPMRNELSLALQSADPEREQTVLGVLKAVNLRGEEPSIVVESEGRTPARFRIAKGEQDDTIGPKLNRRVKILGRHVANDDGESEDWADDVVLLDPPEDLVQAPASW